MSCAICERVSPRVLPNGQHQILLVGGNGKPKIERVSCPAPATATTVGMQLQDDNDGGFEDTVYYQEEFDLVDGPVAVYWKGQP